ncbi:MAG: serine/threonine protein kinase [Planctomycetes bacterium]|nr:serine/threonine protein kinase [Planctomycetota bacterium]
MTEPEAAADVKRQASDESETALVQAAVERFIEDHSCGETPELTTFVQQFPEAIRPRIFSQCREFLAFDGLLGHQQWESNDEVESQSRAFGDFDIQEELGRGGMGVVYLARQRSLNRRVALKVMASGLTLSKRHVERFRREAASAAQLKHPAIVPVHSLVEVDGAFAIAMDYIAGRNLGDILDDLRLANGPDPSSIDGTLGIEPDKGYVAECALFCAQLGSALASAHAQGVVHRDLKPRNLMIDDRRQARLLDFGLSKSLEDGSISMSGEITGTVHYMSPEQTLAKRVAVDHRTDVFALGVILYEMLTLRRPFDGQNLQQVVYEICFKEPVSPQRHNPKVPRDLVTICQKALEKDPDNRYQSAVEFEADLQRFLRWEPIHARPAGALVRLSKWLHRHRTEAIAAAAVFVIAAGGLGYAWYSTALDDREADRLVADAKAKDAEGRHQAAFDSATLALAKRDSDETRTLINLYREKIEKEATKEKAAIAESALMSLASRQMISRDRELAIALALLAVDRRPSSESRSAVLAALSRGFGTLSLEAPNRQVLGARWSPDGRSILTIGQDQDGAAIALLWSGDGTLLHTLRGHASWIVDAAFQPNGKRVATASGDRSVKLWDVSTGELAGIWQHEVGVEFLRFDRTGDRALTHGSARNGPYLAQVWDTVSGRPIAECRTHKQIITAAALSPSGRFAATAGDGGFVRLWSVEAEAEIVHLTGHRGRVAALAFSPDGQLVASASHDGRVRLYRVPDGEPPAGGATAALPIVEFGHSRQVNAIAFAPDGQRLLSGSDDMAARLWRLEANGPDGAGLTVREEHQFVGHTEEISSVGFDPSGQLVVTGGQDGVLRVFDAGEKSTSAGVELMRYETGSRVGGAAFDCSGHRILAWNQKRALIWDFADTRGVVTLRQPGKVPAACFDPSGERLATAGDDENLRLWDARAGRQLWIVGLGNPIDAIDIDSAGERIVASTDGGKVWVRRLSDGAALFELTAHHDDVNVVRFVADGHRILTASRDRSAIVWNATDQSEVMRLERPGPIHAADLSPDGRLLVTVENGESKARLWSVPDAAPRGELSGHAKAISHVAFRPDGLAIATAAADGEVRITALDGVELGRISTGNPVVHFAWNRAGTHLLTSSPGDGVARLWNIAAPQEDELRFAGHTNTVKCNAFSPDGRWAVTTSLDGTACIWPTDPVGVARRLPLRPLTEAELRQHHADSGTTPTKKPN